jgi:CheY-like chemotaxis protein/anti-sigma regulatory factor (Ser/Thr protein kinase)
MSHILVVDDSPVDRTLAGQLLESKSEYHVAYASDGSEALEHMEARLPLAVVTDLQMPVIDGMELVKVIRQQYPKVPVILMTAFGSEDIALEALLLGAADYVPKSRLESDLAESIRNVLALQVMDRPHRKLARCLQYQELRYQLENDAMLIPPLVEQFQQVALEMGLIEQADSMRFARSISEALRNAIYHGNLELPFDHIKGSGRSVEAAEDFVLRRQQEAPYRDRRVDVQGVFSPEQARIVVRDQGPGFDVASLPDVKAEPSRLCEGEGRGLVLIRMFMDHTELTPPGNQITLVKQRQSKARPGK